MLANDFSQLPVMVGEREVKGVVSWSSIGRYLALGVKCSETRECMEAPKVIGADTSLFNAITEIVNNQYVLIRDSSNKISGIVTTSDLSLEFKQLTEPFLLLAEIENHIRQLIYSGGFTKDQLRECCDRMEHGKAVDSMFDLAFGDYIHLFERQNFWTQLNLAVNRSIFVQESQ